MSINFNPSSENRVNNESPNLKSNLEWTITWIKENEPDFVQGVIARLTSGNTAQKEYLTLSFTPPAEWRGNGFANHIPMEQSSLAYYETVHRTYNHFQKFINKKYYDHYS